MFCPWVKKRRKKEKLKKDKGTVVIPQSLLKFLFWGDFSLCIKRKVAKEIVDPQNPNSRLYSPFWASPGAKSDLWRVKVTELPL